MLRAHQVRDGSAGKVHGEREMHARIEAVRQPGRRDARCVAHDVRVGVSAVSSGDTRHRVAGDVPHPEHERQPELGETVVEERQFL